MKRIQVGVAMLSLVLTTGCRSTAAPSPTYLCSWKSAAMLCRVTRPSLRRLSDATHCTRRRRRRRRRRVSLGASGLKWCGSMWILRLR